MAVLSFTELYPHTAPLTPEHAVPLTEAQEGLWYAQSLDPSNPIFNTGHCTELLGSLDVDVFRLAVNTTLAEADALSLRFLEHADGPRQYMDSTQIPTLEVMDLGLVAQAQERAHHLMRQDLLSPLDTKAGPLARHILFIVGPQHFLWYQRVHHLAADGYGMSLIEGRVAQLYKSLLSRDPQQGQALTSFSQVLAEDAVYRQSDKRNADRDFWLGSLAQQSAAMSLSEGAPITAHRFLYDKRPLEAALVSALRQTQERTGVSWPDILTALCALYVSRHIRQPETIVGVPYMGRLGSRSARAVATVMNVAPLRLIINEALTLDDFLRQTEKELRKTRRHGRYRSEQLRRDLGLLGGQRRLHGPTVNVLPFDTPYQLAGLSASQTVLCAGPVEDLTFTFRAAPDAQGLRLEIEANPKLYSLALVQAHTLRLEHFISAALQVSTLAEIPTLTPAEQQHWIHQVNRSAHPVAHSHLWALIETAIGRFPQNTAVEFQGQLISYTQLEQRTRELARRMTDRGVKRNDIVALALPRSADLVVALAAIARIGAAYLPLDFDQPRERLRQIIGSAAPRLVLASPETQDLLPSDCDIMLAGLLQGQTAAQEDIAAPVVLPVDHWRSPAYVIYTSGSTGDPKGVVVGHDAIVNRLLWMQSHYAIAPDDRILQKTPATFDVSVWEFFLPLISGATVVVAPPGAHKDPTALARIIAQQNITTLHFVPSMLTAFLDEPGVELLRPRRVFCSGEALPSTVRDRFHARMHAELHNLYGPTEAAVDVTYWPADASDTSDPVPIGFPVWNTAMYVLDEGLQPVAPGTPGRLYIGGRQLAQGYLGRADLTAERFIADPFQVHGNTMYDTGDIASWRDDGALVFLGRSDHQVKLRGQRIELGEIETALASAPGILAVAVIAREDNPGAVHLVAYLVAHDEAMQNDASVMDHAALRLPDYMLPSAIVWMNDLPVTANGKLHRQALPAPAFHSKAGRAPVSNNEKYVAQLFSQILAQQQPLSVSDDFFDLGGHSLLAARLALQLRRDRGHDFTLGALFEHPTVGRLAAHLDVINQNGSSGATEGYGPLITLRTGPRETTPLFCIHPAGGLSWCYQSLARGLSQPRTVYGLQAPALTRTNKASPFTLDAMASDYVDRVLKQQTEGPYHLAGWSVGGIIAHAMATELQKRGKQVGVLAILDAYPSDSWRDQPAPPPDAVYKALLHIAGHDPDTLVDVPLTHHGVISFLRRSGHPLGELPDAMLQAVFDVVASNNALVRSHEHQVFDGRALYFRAALDHQGENLHPGQWQPYVQALTVHDIASLHAHLTGPDATAHIAPALDAQLAAAHSPSTHLI